MPKTATAEQVDRKVLMEFLRPRHQAVLLTRRACRGVQMSPVTCGVDAADRIVVSTYPQRARWPTRGATRRCHCACCRRSGTGRGERTLVPPTARTLAAGPCTRAGTTERRASRLGRVPRGDDPPGEVVAPRHDHRMGADRLRRLPARGHRQAPRLA